MKRLFAFALTALMLMGCFTGCCCCDFGLGDRIEQIVGEEMNEIVEEQVGQLIGGEQFGQLIGGEQFGQLIGGEITLPKNEATEPPDSDQWMPGNELGLVEPGVLTVATCSDFPPYVYTDDNGAPVGIDMDIVQTIAKKLDLDLVIMDMEFTDALAAVQEGKADMVIGGIVATEDRKEKMDFSMVYTTNTQDILITGRANIKTLDDLQYCKIGVLKNTPAAVYCAEEYGEDNIRLFDDMRELLMNLSSFRVDCVVIDRDLAEHIVYNTSASYLCDYCVEDYQIGVAKGNSALKDVINEVLGELIADGTINGIIDTYYHGYFS